MKQVQQVGATLGLRNSKQELKSDATTRAVRTIIDSETAKREAKTQKLREARLAKEAAEPVVAPVKPKRAAKRSTQEAG